MLYTVPFLCSFRIIESSDISGQITGDSPQPLEIYMLQPDFFLARTIAQIGKFDLDYSPTLFLFDLSYLIQNIFSRQMIRIMDLDITHVHHPP